MAETRAQTAPVQAADAPSPAAGGAAEREHQVVAVLELTVTRPMEAGSAHQRAADEAVAELTRGGSDGWQETSRRVKAVQIRPV